jgi:small subunit ribosomal protein S4
MGDPKFPRRTYDTPSHPWEGERIKEEQELVRRYGLKNKKELWKAQSILRSFRRQSRELQARLRYEEAQAKVETEKLLKRCGRIGLLPMEGSTLDDVLGLNIESFLSRRLQTFVFEKGLASSHSQARQLIVHGHIDVDDQRVTIPGYIVKRGEEAKIEYNPRSPYANDLHPMRTQQADTKKTIDDREPEEKPKKKGGKKPKIEKPAEDEAGPASGTKEEVE